MTTLEQMNENCSRCDDSRAKPAAIDVSSFIDGVCKDSDGNGIYSVGASAAVRAMAHHWKDHLAEGHAPETILPADIDGAIAQLLHLRQDILVRLNAYDMPAPQVLRSQLASCMGELGDIFTDSPESAPAVHAARNLVAMGARLRGTDMFVATGALRLDGLMRVALPLRIDGTVFTDHLRPCDRAPLEGEGNWTLSLTNGSEMALTRYVTDDGEARFVVTDPTEFAKALGL